MAFSLESISKLAVTRAPRILVLGREKIGKSSFACGCAFDENGSRTAEGLNDPIVLPIEGEEGIDDLGVPSFPTIKTFADSLDALRVLYEGGHDRKTLVLDSMSALERVIWKRLRDVYQVDSIEKIGGGYGKGYAAAGDEFAKFLSWCDALRETHGMASILIGHVKVKRFDDPSGESYDRYEFDVHSTMAEMAKRWADVILFATTKAVVKKEDVGFSKEKARAVDVTGGRRYLYTQLRPAHPGGGRGVYGELPYELDLSWPAFEAAVSAAMDKRKKKEKK